MVKSGDPVESSLGSLAGGKVHAGHGLTLGRGMEEVSGLGATAFGGVERGCRRFCSDCSLLRLLVVMLSRIMRPPPSRRSSRALPFVAMADDQPDEPESRVILDPSVLFTEEAFTWLADAEMRPSLVVSQALVDVLVTPRRWEELIPYGADLESDMVARLGNAIGPITRFSHREVENLPDEARRIRDALLSSEDPLHELLADEWVFITSQSIGVLHNDRTRTLDAFRRAGVQVNIVGNDVLARGLGAIRQRLPRWLASVMKGIGRLRLRPRSDFGKLLVIAGNVGVALVPYVGLPVAVAGAITAGSAVIAGDP